MMEPGKKYRIRANITRQTFRSGERIDEHRVMLSPNVNRVGFMVYNSSSNSVYGAFGSQPANAGYYSFQIASNSEFNQPEASLGYTGEITFNPSTAGDGVLMITEFVKEEIRNRQGKGNPNKEVE